MTASQRYDIGAETIIVRQLSNGSTHLRGIGVCNWATVAEWPCNKSAIRAQAGGEACEEFIAAAAELARRLEEGTI